MEDPIIASQVGKSGSKEAWVFLLTPVVATCVSTEFLLKVREPFRTAYDIAWEAAVHFERGISLRGTLLHKQKFISFTHRFFGCHSCIIIFQITIWG